MYPFSIMDSTIFNGVNGDCKTDIVNGGTAAGRPAVLGIGDADDFSVQIEQCTAGVAGIDSAVSLQQIHGGIIGESNFPILGTDRTGGQGEGQLAQRIADGNHTVTHIQVIGIA